MKNIGDITMFGKIVGILFIGERYYLCSKSDVVTLIPADMIEE